MTKLSIVLVVLLCMQPHSSNLKITHIPLENVIQDNKTIVTAFGVGDASRYEMARNIALQRAYAMLSGIVNGYQFEYIQNQSSYEVSTTMNGELGYISISSSERLSESPSVIFLTASVEHHINNFDEINTHAFEVSMVVNDITKLVSEINNKIGRVIHEYAKMQDTLWANGIAYFHDIKVQKNGNKVYDVSYILILVEDAE